MLFSSQRLLGYVFLGGLESLDDLEGLENLEFLEFLGYLGYLEHLEPLDNHILFFFILLAASAMAHNGRQDVTMQTVHVRSMRRRMLRS